MNTARTVFIFYLFLVKCWAFTQILTHTLFQIPNFLHLTPAAIKKHCEALKRNYYSYYFIFKCAVFRKALIFV